VVSRLGPHIVDHQDRAGRFIGLAAANRLKHPLGPASGRQLATDRLGGGVVHHFLKHRKGGAAAVVQWSKTIEHLLGPNQHALAAFLGQPDRAGDDVDGQKRGKLRNRAKRLFCNQAIDQRLRLFCYLGL
jgi:hypothetical protein